MSSYMLAYQEQTKPNIKNYKTLKQLYPPLSTLPNNSDRYDRELTFLQAPLLFLSGWKGIDCLGKSGHVVQGQANSITVSPIQCQVSTWNQQFNISLYGDLNLNNLNLKMWCLIGIVLICTPNPMFLKSIFADLVFMFSPLHTEMSYWNTN